MEKLLFVLLCFLFHIHQTQAQTESLPADFPKYVDTGNPEKDMADLAARKQAWVKANPSTPISNSPHLAITAVDITNKSPNLSSEGDQMRAKIVLTQGEYNVLSPEKKEKIKANPEKYPIQIIPNIQITKLQFLELPETERQTKGKYEIIDLVYTGALPKITDGRRYVHVQEFYGFDYDIQVELLNSNNVVIIPNTASKPKILIAKTEFDAYPEDKRTALINSGEIIIE